MKQRARNNFRKTIGSIVLMVAVLLGAIISLRAQTASFAYQGKLTDNTLAANGTYQMQFDLFDTASGGNQIGTTQTSSVVVVNGVFTVNLGFGAASFDGTDRFLQISVFSTATNAFVALNPRQQITSAPYSIKSLKAETATNAENLGNIPAANFVQTNDSRLSDSRPPTAGSSFYIQNNSSLQAADIYISGEMSANGFNSNFGYSIDGDSVLTAPGVANYFVGYGAGGQTTTGNNNSFFGFTSGFANTTGNNNSLLGSNSNFGSGNLSFATAIGANSVVNTSNTIVLGRNLGQDTVQIPGVLNVATQYNIGGLRVLSVAGTDNLFAGEGAGAAISSGVSNAFFGRNTGLSNTAGNDNSFFGRSAGSSNTTGNNNSFFGSSAGVLNTTGENNSFFGRLSGVSNTTGDNNSFFGRSAGATNTTGWSNAFFGTQSGLSNTTGGSNTFVGAGAGDSNTTGSYNTFVGVLAGADNTIGGGNTYLGYNAKGAAGIFNATAIGSDAFVNQSNQIVLGTDTNFVIIPGNSTTLGLTIANTLRINSLSASGNVALCRNAAFEVATCSSSLRYKSNIADFGLGLSLVNRLRPVTFNWKSDGTKDLGLVAEEVAEVDELLVIRNEKGEVEGVKYDRLGVVLLNAVKEQQAQIEYLKQQVELLKKLVCSQNPNSEICKEK